MGKTINDVYYWCYGKPNIECGECEQIKECIKEMKKVKKIG